MISFLAPLFEKLSLENSKSCGRCISPNVYGLPSNVLLITLNDETRIRKKKEEINQSLEDILHQVNKGLVKYERISHIIIVKDEWTPKNDLLTPTLKVKRRSVEQYYASLIESAFTQPKPIIWE